ncbi:chondroitin AC/alginate lyase [Mucor lusitanicus]
MNLLLTLGPLIFILPSLAFGSPEELKTLYDRKVDFIIQDYSSNIIQIPTWLNTFSSENGTWTDVDYTAGCTARRANWPAQQHFIRIVTMASQYRADPANSTQLLPYISKAMDYWFDHNYAPDACLDQGGLPNSECPCGTPGFWNTNWFGQMILMPKLISNTCILLKSNLTTTQQGNCTLVSQRVYNRIDTDVLGIGPMTGANMLDAATSVLNLGLLTDNETLARDALNHFYNQTTITPGTGVDGVKIDGSYLQHFAQLYTGNYGKDFINSVVVAYIQTSNTSFAPPAESQSAFLTLMNGTEWMIISNHTATTKASSDNNSNSTLLWEYSVIGRMVSFLAADKQASGGVALNLTRIQLAAEGWQNASSIQSIVQRLSDLKTESSSEGQGKLSGTRSFYTSDYLVHRGSNYVTTLKSFSTRTTNSECNNDQNPFGFHLSDGSIFSYIDGDEYIDVFGSYDWNLIPGTTVDYGATPFGCNITQFYGNTTFVGSVTRNKEGASSQGGMAVMQYLNPMTGSLRWEKTFYFFPGFYAVQIGPIYSQGTAPIVTTLDQSNLKGDVYVNNQKLSVNQFTSSQDSKSKHTNIWHNRILYTVLDPHTSSTANSTSSPNLRINTAAHDVNDWSSIGISQGKATQPVFTATIQHPPAALMEGGSNSTTAPVTYIAQLNVDAKQEQNPESLIQFIYQDDQALGKVRGAYHVKDKTIALAFWTAGSYQTPWGISVKTNQPILTFFTMEKQSYTLTVSDPTQLLTQVNVTVTQDHAESKDYSVNLPQGPVAGSSVNVV